MFLSFLAGVVMNVLTGKNILIISPESWGKSYLSKHFYALALLQHNNRVWFLNSRYYKKDEFARLTEKENAGLTIVDDELVRGIHKLPRTLQRIIMRRQIRRLEKKCNTTWDIIWSFDNSRYFMLDCFSNAELRIHHVMDDHMDYQLKICSSSADICLAVTPALVEKCRLHNEHAFFVQHGYAEHKTTSARLERSDALHHVAYIGNLLLPSFDRALMYDLASHFPEVCFHLIGSYGAGNLNAEHSGQAAFLERFQKLKNVIFYSERTYDDALTLAAQADILCLMYFDEHKEVAGNSSKILPYLSTGKVVISNYFSIYEGKNLLVMVKERSLYGKQLQHILDHCNEFNRMELSAVRRTYAEDHSYQHQLNRIDEILTRLQA